MWLKNILFTGIIVAAFFGATELVLSLAGIRPVLLAEDPLVGFAGNVPQFVETTRTDGEDVLITAENKLTLFNFQAFPRHKDPDSYRIFCMGGSTTYGRPYTDQVSFCGWLRAYLQAAEPTRKWEVINTGGISYASYRVARLMTELKDYQPDLFIVYSGQNEFLEQRSYGALQDMPDWVVDLDATLSGTRLYSAMKLGLDALKAGSPQQQHERDRLSGEVDEILNHTLGPQSYHRDDVLKQQIITHYRLNMQRMALIARSVDADIIYVRPAVNIKDMSPFKSEHKEGLALQALMQWQALVENGAAHQQAGDNDAALVDYRKALDIDDRYADLHFRIGRLLFESGRFDEAEKSLRRAVDEDIAPLRILPPMQRIVEQVASSEDAPLIDFADILRRAYRQHYDNAVFGSEYFVDHVHTNMEAYRLLGLALFNELVHQGIATPDTAWNEARIEAVRQEVIAGLDPRNEGTTMLNLGRVFDWAGKFKESDSVLKRALEILGPSQGIYARLAKASYGLGEREEAVQYFREALALKPDMFGMHSRLGMVLAELGQLDEAIEQCRKELALHPEYSTGHAGLAKLLGEAGHVDEAQRHFEIALQLNPDSEFAHLNFASFLISQNRYDDALAHSREVLRINPGQHEAHDIIGLIMKHQGKLDLAIHHFTEAMRLQPDDSVARENIHELQAGTDKLNMRDATHIAI
jgi:tetratricopeptide (TPR) repeat protein